MPWHFLRSSVALGAVRLTFEGGRNRCVTRRIFARHATLLPSPRLQRLGPDRAVIHVLSNSNGPETALLTSHFKLPLMWFSKDRPSADYSCMHPVPTQHSMSALSSVSRCQTRHAFRPCCSSQLRRLTPHAALQVCCTLLPAMGFEAFPPQSPARHVTMTIGPLCLSRTRTSYPPKLFPSQQPFCVTTFVTFPPFHQCTVANALIRDLKALLRYKIRCHRLALLPASGPMLPWALFPFKVLPSSSNALLKGSGDHPPKRTPSGRNTLARPRPGLHPPR